MRFCSVIHFAVWRRCISHSGISWPTQLLNCHVQNGRSGKFLFAHMQWSVTPLRGTYFFAIFCQSNKLHMLKLRLLHEQLLLIRLLINNKRRIPLGYRLLPIKWLQNNAIELWKGKIGKKLQLPIMRVEPWTSGPESGTLAVMLRRRTGIHAKFFESKTLSLIFCHLGLFTALKVKFDTKLGIYGLCSLQ